MQGDLVAQFAYPVCQMESGYLYVFREQSKRGRVILAHNKHVSELIDLTDEERNQFFADVASVARAVHKVFHLHFHIVPKYNGGDEWGGTFQMNPGKVTLTDAEYEEMAEALRQALKEQ